MRGLAIALTLALSGCFGSGGLFSTPDHIPETWPDQADARLHPGVRLLFPSGDMFSQCTAGFLFASADNQTLYLSTAAHCIHGEVRSQVGGPVLSPGFSRPIGTIVFDGWASGEQSRSTDFLLVALDNRQGIRDTAHPALPAWTGPTGVADADLLGPGTRVIGYGHSQQRPEPQTMHGQIIASPSRIPGDPFDVSGQSYADMDPHPISGDSGGPLVTRGGEAVGQLYGGIMLSGALRAEADIYTPLEPQLVRVRAMGGDLAGVRLVTWSG